MSDAATGTWDGEWCLVDYQTMFQNMRHGWRMPWVNFEVFMFIALQEKLDRLSGDVELMRKADDRDWHALLSPKYKGDPEK